MGLFIPTYEEAQQCKSERMSIIESIMAIQDPKALRNIAVFVRTIRGKRIESEPMRLDEFVEMLDFPMVVRLADLFKGEPDRYIVNAQIKELLQRALNLCTGIEEESETS